MRTGGDVLHIARFHKMKPCVDRSGYGEPVNSFLLDYPLSDEETTRFLPTMGTDANQVCWVLRFTLVET